MEMKLNKDILLIFLVAAYVILGLAYFIGSYTPNTNLQAEALLYLEWLSRHQMTPIEYITYWAGMFGFVLSIVSAIGLVFSIIFLRYLFLFSIIILLGSSLFIETPLLITGYQNFIESSAALFAGMILILSFQKNKRGRCEPPPV
jgi:hypothetical protein